MKHLRRLATTLTWAMLPAGVLSAFSIAGANWSVAQCMVLAAPFWVAAAMGLLVSYWLGRRSAIMQIILSLLGGLLPALGLVLLAGAARPELAALFQPMGGFARVVYVLAGALLALSCERSNLRDENHIFSLGVFSPQLAVLIAGYAAIWTLGVGAKEDLMHSLLNYTSVCGLVWFLANVFLIGYHALRKSARAAAGDAVPGDFARRMTVFLVVYTVIVLAAGLFSVLNSGVITATRSIVYALTWLFNTLFPTRAGEFTNEFSPTATAGPGFAAGTPGNPTLIMILNALYYLAVVVVAAYVLYKLTRWLMKKIPQWRAKYSAKVGESLEKWRDDEAYHDVSEDLFNWDSLKKRAGQSLRRAAERLRPPKRLSDCADNAQRVRLLYQRHMRRLHKAGRLDASATPLEAAGDDAQAGELARVYSQTRYAQAMPDDNTVQQLDSMRRW